MKQLLTIILALALLFTMGIATAEAQDRNGGNAMPGGNGAMRGGNRSVADKSGDAELQAMITEIVPKFQLLTFDDAETGTSRLRVILCD